MPFGFEFKKNNLKESFPALRSRCFLCNKEPYIGTERYCTIVVKTTTVSLKKRIVQVQFAKNIPLDTDSKTNGDKASVLVACIGVTSGYLTNISLKVFTFFTHLKN